MDGYCFYFLLIMLTNVIRKDVQELYSTPIVQQTSFWSNVKNELGDETLAINFTAEGSYSTLSFKGENGVESDLLVVLQYIDHHHCIAYVPYGPEFEPAEEDQGTFLEELSESLRSFLPAGCILVRYDLCWESYWAKDEACFDADGSWKGEPSIQSQELRFNYGTVNWNFKRAQYNILPFNTIFVDLDREAPLILNKMHAKTRYNINLAARKGVVVRSLGMESLDVWYALYQETAIRNRILINDMKYFEAVLKARSEDCMAPAEVLLLVAEVDQQPLAAMFLIISGLRGSYLYGASSSQKRNFMATYALQWEAMKIAKARGCTEYDMFGVSPNADSSHPMYGLYKFKSGFGGEIFHGLGCWDYPLDHDKYNLYKSMELKSQGFHLA